MKNKEILHNQIEKLNINKDSIVLMHSSLRSIGKEYDANTLIDIFKNYLEDGLFCIPTHTWAFLENEFVLDLTAPKTCIGTLPDIAIKREDALISLHPTHSMAVFGKSDIANSYIKDEPLSTTPTPELGCYGKLYSKGGYVLLAGVSHNRNTYIHAIEEMLGVENRIDSHAKEVKIKDRKGNIHNRIIHPHKAVGIGDVSLNYVKYEDAFRYHGCIHDVMIGNSKAMLCSAVGMKEVVELIEKRSGYKDILINSDPIPFELYK